MNAEHTKNKLLNGLYHRPYSTTMSVVQLEELANELNVKVEIIPMQMQDSDIKCVFEVKP